MHFYKPGLASIVAAPVSLRSASRAKVLFQIRNPAFRIMSRTHHH